MKSFCGLCANFIKTWGCGVTRKALSVLPRRVMVGAIRVYQRFVSPVLPPSCRFYPSCSRYTLLAVQKHGVLKGGLMGAWRILRCNPFSKGGFDPVR